MKLIYWLLITLLVSILFLIFPNIDLVVAHWFFQVSSDHPLFLLEKITLVDSIRKLIINSLWTFNGALGVILLAKLINPKWFSGVKVKTAIYILSCFIIAPGLVVNDILKDHWGRPRPTQISQFSGHKEFQPAWVISNQCDHNCAFVCGDCAAVFALFALVPLMRRKKTIIVVVTASGMAIGFLRMAAGGHFLSDVILSGLLVCGIELFIYWLLYRRYGYSLTEEYFEMGILKLHQRLIKWIK